MNTLSIHQRILGEKNNCIIPNDYIRLFDGDYVAAVVLKDAVYWSGHWSNTDRGGWFEMPASAWKERSHLSAKQVSRATSAINARARKVTGTDSPLLDQDVRKVKTKSGQYLQQTSSYYRVDPDIFESIAEFIATWGDKSTDIPGSSQGEDPGSDQRDVPGSDQRFVPSSGTPSGGPSDTTSLPTVEKKKTPTNKTEAGRPTGMGDDEWALFEKFYSDYPHKTGKKQAAATFKKLKITEELLPVVMAKLEYDKQNVSQFYEGIDLIKKKGVSVKHFIPHPSTWLNRETWMEDYWKTAPVNTSTKYRKLTEEEKQQQREAMQQGMSDWGSGS